MNSPNIPGFLKIGIDPLSFRCPFLRQYVGRLFALRRGPKVKFKVSLPPSWARPPCGLGEIRESLERGRKEGENIKI